MKNNELVKMFVYGTLKQGYRNNRLLANCKLIGEGELLGHAMYSLGSFPGVIPSFDDADSVFGEIYEVDPESLVRIDRLESNGDLYLRKFVNVKTVNGIMEVETYIFNRVVNEDTKIESGIFS